MDADKRKPAYECELWVVGTDAHTTAICDEVATWYRATLRQIEPESLPKALQWQWSKITLLVLEHSADPRFEVLSSITLRFPKLQIVVVTPRRSEEVAIAAIQRRARSILLRPCQFQDINAHFNFLWIQRALPQKPKHEISEANQGLGYCRRCDAPLVTESGFNLRLVEKGIIRSAILQERGNKLSAAKLLGIGKTTLYRKLREYGLVKVSDKVGDAIIIPSPS